MDAQTFDWRLAVAADPRYVAQDAVPERVRGGVPPEAWKSRIVAAHLKDDQLRESTRHIEAKLGLLPAVAGGLRLLGKALFGFSVGPETASVRDIVLGAEEAALVVRDGRILGTYTQARVTHGGGFVAWLSGLVGTSRNYQILIVDAAPFDLVFEFARDGGATTLATLDHVVLSGALSVRVQFDVDHLDRVLGLLHGRTLLLRDHVQDALRDVVFGRVLVPTMRAHRAADVRGSVGLQDKVRADVISEVETAYRDVGLRVRDATLSIALTDDERVAIREGRRGVEDRLAEGATADARRRMERETDLEVASREMKHRLATLEASLAMNQANLAEKQRLLQDLETAALRRQRQLEDAKGEVEVARVRREIAGEEERFELERRRLRLDVDRIEAQLGLDLKERRELLERLHLKGVREIEREDALERERATRQGSTAATVAVLDAQRGLTPEQLMAIGAQSNPAVAQALIEKYRAEAARDEAAQRRMQDLMDRQVDIAHQMAQAHGAQITDVARVAAGAGSGEKRRETESKDLCPKCAKEVLARWRACPYCGQALVPG